jgi:hypothetical protein
MVQDFVVLGLVLAAVSVVPALLLWGFMKVIDYGADEEKLAEIRRARREGRQPDFTGVSGSSIGIDEGDTAGEEYGASTTSGGQIPTRESVPDSSPAASGAESTVTCSACGRENDAAYDRCWNCLSDL